MTEIEQLKKDHSLEMYRVLYQVKKLNQKHDLQKLQIQEMYKRQITQLQRIVSQKQLHIEQLERKLSQKDMKNNLQIDKLIKTVLKSRQDFKFEQKIKEILKKDQIIQQLNEKVYHLQYSKSTMQKELEQLTKTNKQLSQQLKINHALQNIFIQQKSLLIQRNYNKNSNASINGFNDNGYWNFLHNTTLTSDGLYLNIPQKIISDKNIKWIHKLIRQNQWNQLQHFCFNPRAQLEPQQQNYIDGQLWKSIVSSQKKFQNLKILNICNHRILSIQKSDLQKLSKLELLDFRTNSIKEKVQESYKKTIQVLKQFAKYHPNVEILVTINGQQQSWRLGKVKMSKDMTD